MNIQQKRLIGLIEYVKQLASMNIGHASNCSKHGVFCLFEDEALSLPYLKFNQNFNGEEIWIEVPRIPEKEPPIIQDPLLSIWVKQSKKPKILPTIQDYISINSLKEVVEHAEGFIESKGMLIYWDDFKNKQEIEDSFQIYLTLWKTWAEEEKCNSKLRELYKHLYMLKQHLELGISSEQLEIVIGVGVISWQISNKKVNYPLITKAVDIILDEKTLSIKIIPKISLPTLEITSFVENNIIGVEKLEKSFHEFYQENSYISPFDSNTFESILRSGVTFLDHSGVYLPDIDKNTYRKVPKPENKLIITDTWVIFARPRTSSILVNDLNNFIKKIGSSNDDISNAISALVTDPEDIITEQEMPEFRGLSVVNSNLSGEQTKVNELYFPLPFNDEQVRIIQMLEYSNGVVVQGPPGTGKTHTIANIICHHLALGKKVLVTSMRDHALLVLQEKIPELIRPLTVSMLSNDRAGMQQFEDSITKIASEIQIIDKNIFIKEIKAYDGEIDNLHAYLKQIQFKINQLAKINIEPIKIDDIDISPVKAAEELIGSTLDISWIPDLISIGYKYNPTFSENDILSLKQAKLEIGEYLQYLEANNLSNILEELPTLESILKSHYDLSYISKVRFKIEEGVIPRLANNSNECIKNAEMLLINIKELMSKQALIPSTESWVETFTNYLHKCHANNKFDLLEEFKLLGDELILLERRKLEFIKVPVDIPLEITTNYELKNAITNLSQSKKPFGIKGIVGKQKEKSLLAKIMVASSLPVTAEDWQFVLSYIQLQKDIKALCNRWNSLVTELNISSIQVESNLSELLDYHCKITNFYEFISQLYDVKLKLTNVIPSWVFDLYSKDLNKDILLIKEFLEQHLGEHNLSATLSAKLNLENIAINLPSPIKEQFNKFIQEMLGKVKYNNEDISSNWNQLINELKHIISLSNHFNTVKTVVSLIEASGAPKLAKLISEDKTYGINVLPHIWMQVWRLKRLHTYLSGNDTLNEFKELFKSRVNAENRLAKTYKMAITKRSWLKLTENATPKVKSALQSFMASVRAVGKGTGKRAFIHRANARMAAQEAILAIPCWIMPHYKIPEHLPSNLGDFDLVIIDEASQSDFSAFPALLRAKKVLVVGDDKQVSPESVGTDLTKVGLLMKRYLNDQVATFCPQFTPERSIYDLFKVVFANSLIMLREHFRCVGAIIEYSKREFYNHELHPLRLPKKSELLQPPLIDVWVKDGVRDEIKKINKAEAKFIVTEIKRITDLEEFNNRTIGVVTLLGNEQSRLILEMLQEELAIEKLEKHKIACGDPKIFQGNERDIMFISMVASSENGVRPHPITRETYSQRFNVAASRARDRMYLVRSLSLDELSSKDDLRRGMLEHFINPYRKDEKTVENLRELCESPFEIEVYDFLTERGYSVTPQVRVGEFRIDLVVEGDSDSRLAIECDGDKYHGGYEQWERDIRRQRILERAGWKFWRCFASHFTLKRNEVMNDLLHTLNELNIHPTNIVGSINRNYVENREYFFANT